MLIVEGLSILDISLDGYSSSNNSHTFYLYLNENEIDLLHFELGRRSSARGNAN